MHISINMCCAYCFPCRARGIGRGVDGGIGGSIGEGIGKGIGEGIGGGIGEGRKPAAAMIHPGRYAAR